MKFKILVVAFVLVGQSAMAEGPVNQVSRGGEIVCDVVQAKVDAALAAAQSAGQKSGTPKAQTGL